MVRDTSPDGAGDFLPARIVSAFGLIIALLHLYGALLPGSSNWGFHFAGYFPLPVKLAVPLLMLAMLLPPVQERIVALITTVASAFGRRPRRTRTAVAIIALALSGAVLWLARERLSLLGDGFLVVRRIALIETVENVAAVFKHEPLPGLFMWRFWQLFQALGIPVPDEFPTRLVSMLAGAGSLPVLALLVRRLTADAVDRALLFLFVVGCGSTQLFFGYMENYALLYFAILLFTYLSVLHLDGVTPLPWPAAAFGLLFVTHFASLVFLPLAAFLGWRRAADRAWRELAWGAATFLAVSAGLLMMCGYSIGTFFDLLLKSEKHIIPLTEITTRFQAYTFLSGAHLLNIANLHLLLSPFAALLFLAAVLRRPRALLRGKPVLTFLAIGAVCGLVFTTTLNADLGLSRDWDLPAPFLAVFVLAGGVFFLRFTPSAGVRRRLMAMMTGVMLLHTGSWVALNADGGRSLERFLSLPDERYWGTSALASACEVLGYHYFERGDLPTTARYLEKYVTYDAPYVRVWEMLGDVYRYMGDERNELRAYEGAIAHGSRSITAFTNAALVHAAGGNFPRALELTRAALELDSSSVEANNNYGTFVIQAGGGCTGALPYFLRAIASDSTFTGAYINAARCLYLSGEHDRAAGYASTYLRREPRGAFSDEARRIIAGDAR